MASRTYVNAVVNVIEATYPTAAKLVTHFEERGLLQEMTGFRRNRVFRYSEYVALFSEAALATAAGDVDETAS